MASLNKAMLIGYLGAKPEVRAFQDGTKVANASLATSEKWRDKQTGEQREKTEWHNLVFVGKNAELAEQYLDKGSPLFVEGQLQTRKWQDKNGQDRYTTEVRVWSMQFLGKNGDANSAPAQYASNPAPANPAPANPAPAQYAPAPSVQMGMIEMSQQALAREGVHVPQYQPPAESNNGFDDFEDDVPF